MKMKCKSSVVSILLALLLFSSCKLDELDLGKIVDPELGVGVKAPVAKADYKLSDFIDEIEDEEDLLIVDEDGLYHILYQENDFFTYQAMNLVDVPDRLISSSLNIGISKILGNVYSGPIPAGGINIPIVDQEPYLEESKQEIDLGNSGTEKDVFLSELVLDECNFELQMESNLSTNVVTTIMLSNCFINDESVKIELTNANPNRTISLAGATVVFDENDGENMILYSTSVSIPDDNNVYVAPHHAVNVFFELGSVSAYKVEGYFGQRTIDIDAGSLDFGSDLFEDLGEGLELFNPTLTLRMKNSIVIPASVDFNIASEKTGESPVYLDADKFELVLPSTPEETANKEYIISKGNSNIVNLIASLPSDELNYSGNVIINPSSTDRTNVITKNSSIAMDMEIDMPLELKTEGFTLKDTIDFDGIDDDLDIEKTVTKVKVNNLIPMAIVGEILFIDADSKEPMSRVIELGNFAAAKTDDVGNEIEATTTEVEITLTADELERIKGADRVLFNATLSSPDQGQKVGRLKASQSVSFEIKIESKLTL